MKIAMLGTRGIPPLYGGTEVYIEYLSMDLAEKGDKVTVYCQKMPGKNGYKKSNKLYHPNIKRVEIPSISSKHLDNLIRTLLSTIHVCLDPSVQIVQFNNAGPCLFSFIPRLFGKKVIGAMRAIDSKREKWDSLTSFLLRLGERLSVTFAHVTTVNSLSMKKYFKNRYKAGTVYIPNGVNLPTRKLPPNMIKKWGLEEKNFILFLARLEPEKGCHTLIQAFNKLIDKRGNLRLAIAGHSGHSHHYYEQLVKNANDKILFLGYASGRMKEELFSNAFAFALPSSVEGMSNSLLSAMAYGLPVIVSDIPENLAVIDNAPFDNMLKDKPGLSFRLWDADDLASKLNILLTDLEKAKDRGKILQSYVKTHFKLEDMNRNTRDVYFQIFHKKIE